MIRPQRVGGGLPCNELEYQNNADLGRLLRIVFSLPGSRKAHKWEIPDAPGGIVRVFKLYYQMLDAALLRGYEPGRSLTPLERVPELCEALPGAPLEQITRCFNAACYGRLGSPEATVDELHSALQRALSAAPSDPDSAPVRPAG